MPLFKITEDGVINLSLIKKNNMKKAVIIFSGGQDSTTCLYWAKQKFDEVEAITFFYGQNHAVELEAAKDICIAAGVKQTIVDISFFKELVESNMTSGGDTSQVLENGLPTSFVPNRNQLFITLAHAYAQKIGAVALVTGVCETDYSGYPDCRDKFITDLQTVTNQGSQANIIIWTPLMHINKAATFQLAEDLGVLNEVILLSHTCYKGVETLNEWGKGCGECPACVLRKKGYEEFISKKLN